MLGLRGTFKYHTALVDKVRGRPCPRTCAQRSLRTTRPILPVLRSPTGRSIRYSPAASTPCLTPKLTRRLFVSAEVLLLVSVVGGTVLLSHPEEWRPLLLAGLLLGAALLGEWFTVETSDGMLSASLVAIVLAMSLLGPVPAAVCAVSPP